MAELKQLTSYLQTMGQKVFKAYHPEIYEKENDKKADEKAASSSDAVKAGDKISG